MTAAFLQYPPARCLNISWCFAETCSPVVGPTKNMIIYVYCLLKQVLELVNHFFEQDLGGICITTF